MENSENNIFEQYAELVRRMKAGDEFAFNELFDKTKKLVYATCYGILNNQQDAEEAMMDTYLAVSQNIGTLEDDNTFLKWLKTIAANKSRDKLKARKGDLSYDDAVETGEDLEGDDDLETLPDSYVMDKTKRDALMKILRESLSDVQFQTILLHYYDELSYEDIAGIMGCPKETVKSRLKLSRKIIKDRVTEYEKANMDKLMGGAASAPFLGRFFNAFADDLTIPKINPFPTKSTANPKGDIVKHGTAKATSKSFTEKAVFDAGAKATLAGASGVKMTLIAVSVLLGIGVIGGAIYGISRLVANNAAEETEETEIEETEETGLRVDASVIDYNGHSYALFDIGSSWEEAEAYCESVGGHLAVISTQEENDVIHAYAQSRGCDNVYIGYSDASNEGNWEWVNGESSSYTNWNEDEPNAYTPEENYAVMSQNGCWNDCAYTPFVENGNIIYVCEWECIVVANENLDGMEILAAMPEETEPSETEVVDVRYSAYGRYLETLESSEGSINMYWADVGRVSDEEEFSCALVDVTGDGLEELLIMDWAEIPALNVYTYDSSSDSVITLLQASVIAGGGGYSDTIIGLTDAGSIVVYKDAISLEEWYSFVVYTFNGTEFVQELNVEDYAECDYDTYELLPHDYSVNGTSVSADEYNSNVSTILGSLTTILQHNGGYDGYSFSPAVSDEIFFRVAELNMIAMTYDEMHALLSGSMMPGEGDSSSNAGSGQTLNPGDRIDINANLYQDFYVRAPYSVEHYGNGDWLYFVPEIIDSVSADGNVSTTMCPESEFHISTDVIIIDNTNPFNADGIYFTDSSTQYDLASFIDMVNSGSGANLFVRVAEDNSDEIVLIVINP